MNVRQKSRESPCYIGFVLSEFLVRDPRTKTGWSWTERFGPVPRTGPGPEKFWKSGTDSDRSVPGPGGPWIPVSSDVCILRVCILLLKICVMSHQERGVMANEFPNEVRFFAAFRDQVKTYEWVRLFKLREKIKKWLTFLKIMKIREKIILWRIIIFNYFNNKNEFIYMCHIIIMRVRKGLKT